MSDPIEWDIDANLPMYTRDYLRIQKELGEESESLTHREEFESQFGTITDEQWEWLKRFVKRIDSRGPRVRDIVGVRHVPSGCIYHPTDLEYIIDGL